MSRRPVFERLFPYFGFPRPGAKPAKPPEPPKPDDPERPTLAEGTLRIVPFGAKGFAVERFEVTSPNKARYMRMGWVHQYGSDVTSRAACADYCREALRIVAEREARQAALREAVRLHAEANPPRIVTLETLEES